MDQETIFVNGEGDNWFRRNQDYLAGSASKKNDLELGLIAMFKLAPLKVLEVGASNGFRLAAIAERYNAACFGVDPSEEAIKDGNQRYPFLHLYKGVASSLPFDDEEFDLVVIYGVFSWVDRKKLLKSASEIDRVLQWNGYLIIGDFLPSNPCKARYHHLPTEDVWTYKQNYSKLFTASNLYHIVGCITGANHEVVAEVLPQDRFGSFLLQKRAEYEEVRIELDKK